jgi:hypothetical protein
VADITDRLLAVCDAAALALSTAWSPIAPDAVTRDYVTEAIIASFQGRKVYVKPNGCGRIERLDRGEVINEYRISARVLKRFTDPGAPTKAWVDAEVSWLGTNIYRPLYLEDPGNYLLGSLWTEAADIVDAVSEEQLLAEKLFWAEVEIAFREIATQ